MGENSGKILKEKLNFFKRPDETWLISWMENTRSKQKYFEVMFILYVWDPCTRSQQLFSMEAARDQTSKFVTKNYTTLTHVSNFWHNAKLNKIQGRMYRKSQPQLLGGFYELTLKWILDVVLSLQVLKETNNCNDLHREGTRFYFHKLVGFLLQHFYVI